VVERYLEKIRSAIAHDAWKSFGKLDQKIPDLFRANDFDNLPRDAVGRYDVF
jgi:hypothetical protein